MNFINMIIIISYVEKYGVYILWEKISKRFGIQGNGIDFYRN